MPQHDWFARAIHGFVGAIVGFFLGLYWVGFDNDGIAIIAASTIGFGLVSAYALDRFWDWFVERVRWFV
jgi:hypothetical protein